ncbi:zinc-binding dehydrogenase [Pseudoxanthomonas jiangsuensis]|uniref:zinc-binding dehydrogenase n=1 Tax=Pseudoxanthomonas jiangsuensis TaxID=619688 RepID=UPI0013908584|nr:zinc-binding dehydrogenase [Pseudoxanthomonas jiangsuensis]
MPLAHWPAGRDQPIIALPSLHYTAGPFEEKLEGLDVVVNTVDDQGQTASRALRTLRRDGALVSITGPADAAKAEAAGVRNLAPQRPAPNQPGLSTATILTRIGELADAGKYRVHVEETLPLAQAAQAWERSRSGRTRGKLVLAID